MKWFIKPHSLQVYRKQVDRQKHPKNRVKRSLDHYMNSMLVKVAETVVPVLGQNYTNTTDETGRSRILYGFLLTTYSPAHCSVNIFLLHTPWFFFSPRLACHPYHDHLTILISAKCSHIESNACVVMESTG